MYRFKDKTSVARLKLTLHLQIDITPKVLELETSAWSRIKGFFELFLMNTKYPVSGIRSDSG